MASAVLLFIALLLSNTEETRFQGSLVANAVEFDNNPRMALCLVGSAREFELTGPSILKRLVRTYEEETGGRLDLFVNSPLDEQSHKMWILQSAQSIAAFRVFPNSDMDNNISAGILIDPALNSLQGMLQYFRIVEGCLPLISNYEAKNGFKYKWIMRTRLDTFWSGPPPPLDSFNLSRYTVPNGSYNLGLNDRLGVGGQKSNKAALSRISLIPELSRAGYRKLNSENAFKAQLEVSGIDPGFGNFSFCILSRRVYKNSWVPVVSMASRAPLNGAKCRPCSPQITGKKAEGLILQRGNGWAGWLGPYVQGIEFCNAIDDWEDGWERIFDDAVGEDMAADRRGIVGLSTSSCVYELEKLRKKAELWDAPSPLALCKRGTMGKSASRSDRGAHFVVLSAALHGKSVFYSAVNKWDDSEVRNIPYGLGDRVFRVYQLLKSAQETVDFNDEEGEAMAKALNVYFKQKEHTKIDLLYISIEQQDMVRAWKNRKVRPPEICQLAVLMGISTPEGDQKLLKDITEIGFQLERCVNHGKWLQKRCTFFSPWAC